MILYTLLQDFRKYNDPVFVFRLFWLHVLDDRSTNNQSLSNVRKYEKETELLPKIYGL